MNSSHQTRYMYSSAKSVVLKHCSTITDWGMDRWVKDIGGNFFLIRHITWADLDGFIISICARTPSLCPPLCSSFLCLLLSFTHEMSHSQPSLTHICLLLVTSSFPNFSHSTSFRQPIFCCLLSLSLNFLLHYSFLTFAAAWTNETLPLWITLLFYPFQRWVIWEEWKGGGLTPWPLQAGDQILLLYLWFIMGPISEGWGCYCIFPL